MYPDGTLEALGLLLLLASSPPAETEELTKVTSLVDNALLAKPAGLEMAKKRILWNKWTRDEKKTHFAGKIRLKAACDTVVFLYDVYFSLHFTMKFIIMQYSS